MPYICTCTIKSMKYDTALHGLVASGKQDFYQTKNSSLPLTPSSSRQEEVRSTVDVQCGGNRPLQMSTLPVFFWSPCCCLREGNCSTRASSRTRTALARWAWDWKCCCSASCKTTASSITWKTRWEPMWEPWDAPGIAAGTVEQSFLGRWRRNHLNISPAACLVTHFLEA